MGGQNHSRGGFDRPELAVIEAAKRSHWVLTTEELDELGLSEREISARVRTGFLHHRHHGVYAIGRPELSFEGDCLAAVRACGPDSAVSHATAGALWEIRKHRGVIHVSAPRSRTKHPGLLVHRPRSLPLDARTDHRGVPVTTVARTLLDMAAGVPERQVGWALHEASVQKILDLRAVVMELERNPRHRGRRKLGRLAESEAAPLRSELEVAGLAICRRLPLPEPEPNALVWTDREEEVDLCWRKLSLIVEWDGGRYHATRWRQRMDAEKTERLMTAQWKVRRFSGLEVAVDPEAVAAKILAAATSGR